MFLLNSRGMIFTIPVTIFESHVQKHIQVVQFIHVGALIHFCQRTSLRVPP